MRGLEDTVQLWILRGLGCGNTHPNINTMEQTKKCRLGQNLTKQAKSVNRLKWLRYVYSLF